MDTTDAFSLIPERHFLQRKRPSGLCQVQAQTFLVTCRKGLGAPSPGGRQHRNKRSAHVCGVWLPPSSLKHSPVLSGKENMAVHGGGCDTDTGVSNRLLITQLPRCPVSAPDLRLEAEVPRPRSSLCGHTLRGLPSHLWARQNGK